MRRVAIAVFLLVAFVSGASAQFPWMPAPGFSNNSYPFSGWDTTWDTSQLAYSGTDDTIATCTDCISMGFALALSANANPLSKKHFEITYNGTGSVGNDYVGITQRPPSGNQIGVSNQSVGYTTNGKVYLFGPTVTTTLASWGLGSTVCAEVDGPNHLMWFQIATGVWNPTAMMAQISGTSLTRTAGTAPLGIGVALSDSGALTAGTRIVGGSDPHWQVNNSQSVASKSMTASGDPANDIGGINIALLPIVQFPGFSFLTPDTTRNAVINTGGSTFACTVSTGYAAWH